MLEQNEKNQENNQWKGINHPGSSFEQFNLKGTSLCEGDLSNSSFQNLSLEGTTIKYANVNNL